MTTSMFEILDGFSLAVSFGMSPGVPTIKSRVLTSDLKF